MDLFVFRVPFIRAVSEIPLTTGLCWAPCWDLVMSGEQDTVLACPELCPEGRAAPTDSSTVCRMCCLLGREDGQGPGPRLGSEYTEVTREFEPRRDVSTWWPRISRAVAVGLAMLEPTVKG